MQDPEPAHMVDSYARPSRRGQVESWYDGKSELPPFVRKREALGHTQRRQYAPGTEEFIFDEDEFEMPAFIRRQAD